MEKMDATKPLPHHHDGAKKSDVIEIPVGKFFSKVRKNPWIVSTFVLAIALILILSFGKGIGGETVSKDKAGESVLKFLNSNPSLQGQVTLISVEKENSFYKATLAFNGQDVPVYVTLDGNYLLAGQPVSLNGEIPEQDNTSLENADEVDESQMSPDDDAVLGKKEAPITIVEFSDFQCPYCRKFWTETYAQLKKEYIDTGKAKLVFRDYPLSIHPMAHLSSEAAECVRKKGGDVSFWKMHDKIFEEQNVIDSGSKEGPVKGTAQYTKDDLKKWAKSLGFDISSCLDNGEMKAEVDKDLADGGDLGTPTFFVNGVKLEGAVPYAQFKSVLDSQLAA